MRRLCRALRNYFGSRLTWRTCWRHAKDAPRFQVVARDGFRYVEPRPAEILRIRGSDSPASLRSVPAHDIQ